MDKVANKQAAPRQDLTRTRLRAQLEVERRAERAAIRPATEEKYEPSPREAAAVKLYGRGIGRKQASAILAKYYKGNEKRAWSALKRMEREQWFLDAIWEEAILYLQLEAPAIALAMARKGKLGRIQEGKFALELADRYHPAGAAGPTTVNVIVGSVPRPKPVEGEKTYDIDGEAEEVPDSPLPRPAQGESRG